MQYLVGKFTKKGRGGFTLVELLVVIVVLAVLAAIVLPKFMDSSKRSKESALKSDLKVVRNAVSLFKTDTDLYPLSLADLAATAAPAKGNDGTNDVNLTAGNWHGPYLQSVPDDPVGGAALTYTKTTGVVTSSTAGNGLDGTAYSAW
jgi:general secretion pathway protein G